MKQYRQGDLLIIEVDDAPQGELKGDRIILGSHVTGHAHALSIGKVYVCEPTRSDNANFYLKIPSGGAEITHDEHKPIPLSEGVYKVIRQREVNGYVVD